VSDLQGRPHGSLGVFFMCGGPTEIGQDAITDIAGDKAVVARNHVAAEGSIRVHPLLGPVRPLTENGSITPDLSMTNIN